MRYFTLAVKLQSVQNVCYFRNLVYLRVKLGEKENCFSKIHFLLGTVAGEFRNITTRYFLLAVKMHFELFLN